MCGAGVDERRGNATLTHVELPLKGCLNGRWTQWSGSALAQRSWLETTVTPRAFFPHVCARNYFFHPDCTVVMLYFTRTEDHKQHVRIKEAEGRRVM